LLLALVLGAAAHDARQRAPVLPPVLFDVDVEDSGKVTLDPIGFIREGGQLTDVPVGDIDDSAANAFRRAYYGRAQPYRVFSGDFEAGHAIARGAGDPGCSGLYGDAILKLRLGVNPKQPFLAVNDTRLRSPATRRHPLSPADRTVLFGFAQKLFADSGVPPSLQGKASLIAGARIVLWGGRSMLVGSLEVDTIESGDTHVVSLLVGAEGDESGYRPTLLSFANGVETEARSERFVDVLSIFGDTTLQLLSRSQYYESHDFSVFRREKNAWVRWYSGGGGGC
jgi:hypothetical protein